MANYKCDYYVERFLLPTRLQQTVADVVAYIRRNKLTRKFDTIAFRGMSGALVAPLVALKLHKELIMVRKSESRHTSHSVEGYATAKRVLILDDFVSTGNTVRTITRRVAEFTANQAVIIGTLEYANLDDARYLSNNGYFYQLEAK